MDNLHDKTLALNEALKLIAGIENLVACDRPLPWLAISEATPLATGVLAEEQIIPHIARHPIGGDDIAIWL